MSSRRVSSKKQVTPRTFVLLGSLVLIVIMIAVLVSGISRNRQSENKYIKGVYVNGTDMSVFSREDGENEIRGWADRVLETEYTLTYNDRTWSFKPSRDVGAAVNGLDETLAQAWNLGHTGTSSERSRTKSVLSMNPQMLTAELTYSESMLDSYITEIKNAIDVAPVNAQIVVTETEPKIIAPSADGVKLDFNDTYDILVDLINNGGETTVALPVTVAVPDITSNDDEGGLTVIAEWTTDMTISSWTRRGNVRIALNCFNGMAVQPNEIISFNDVVGERTAEKGYVEATVYSGATTTTGIGGGVCQASSTLYGAVMSAGLEFIERNHHAMVVSYTPGSCDAAVDWDAKQDFSFINNTDGTVYFFTYVDKEVARVTVYGKKPKYRIELESKLIREGIVNEQIVYVDDVNAKYCYFEDETKMYKEGKKGRISELWRVYYDWDTDEEVSRELISEDNYAGEAFTYLRGVHKR